MNVTRAWRKPTKRSPKMSHGLVASSFLVELDNDKVKRRVYENWTAFKKGCKVPMLVKLPNSKTLAITQDQIDLGVAEAERKFNEFLTTLD